MLDQMTKGRVDFGFIRGLPNRVNKQFNPNADRRDPKRNSALLVEALEVIIKAWTEEAFSHHGEFYTFPVPGHRESPSPDQDPRYYAPDGEMIALGVMPKPYQKPHPPIWQMADALPSYAFAAERGFGTMCYARSFEGVREVWTLYKEIASRIHGRDIPMGETPDGRKLAVGQRLTYVAPTMEQAEQDTRERVNAVVGFTAGLKDDVWTERKAWLAESEELTEDDLNADWFDFSQRHDLIWVGSPDYVAEKIEKLRSELNCDHVTIWPNISFLSFEEQMRSLYLFAEQVMPRFQAVKVA